MGIDCSTDETTKDIIRGIRLHAPKLLKGLQADDLIKAQLGLGHSYSRAKLKFNVNRIDNMIIQAIALLDQLDKDVNLFSMRIREWYGYHFPELVKLVPDNYQYARAAQFIGAKETLDEEKLHDLAAILACLDADADLWAQETAASIRAKSPTACAISLRMLVESPKQPHFVDEMRMEYALMVHAIRFPDLREGVRALLIDKDNAPDWQPAVAEAVLDDMVDQLFVPLPPGEEWTPFGDPTE